MRCPRKKAQQLCPATSARWLWWLLTSGAWNISTMKWHASSNPTYCDSNKQQWHWEGWVISSSRTGIALYHPSHGLNHHAVCLLQHWLQLHWSWPPNHLIWISRSKKMTDKIRQIFFQIKWNIKISINDKMSIPMKI